MVFLNVESHAGGIFTHGLGMANGNAGFLLIDFVFLFIATCCDLYAQIKHILLQIYMRIISFHLSSLFDEEVYIENLSIIGFANCASRAVKSGGRKD